MITVSTAELKTHLGHYLRLVRNGESINVTSHRHPVAQLVPSSAENDLEVIEPTRSIEVLRDLKAVSLAQSVDGVEALLADRGRR
mgnify:CR=1 FL=1|jgi:prevent-host-death family protein